MKKMIDNIRKYLPAVLLLLLLLFCIRYREDLSVERILRYTPEEPVKAALLMLGLYAVKSVSFIFPIAILQLAVGHLFATGTALLVNFLGRAVTLALPYWMGRFSGASMVESLTAKYPKLKNSSRLPERKFPVYFIFYADIELFTGRCCESVSRSRKDPIWNLYGRWRAWNAAGSYSRYNIWSKYQKSEVSGILALCSASCDDQCVLDPDTQAYFPEEKITGLSLPAFTERKNVV